MSVTVNFFSNANDNRVVNKVLTPTFNSVVELYDDKSCSIQEPHLKLDWNEALSQSNYMYIPIFHRYYYIQDVTVETGGAMSLRGLVDPLMSFKESIYQIPGVLKRSERKGFQGRNRGTYVRDPKLPIYPKKNFKVVEFSNSVFNIDVATHSSFNFVLNVAGGGNGGSGQ